MDKEVLTTVTFEENCEYQLSVISKKVQIPQQTVQIEIQISNTESNRPANIYYYDDKIKLQAKVFQEYQNSNNQTQRTYIQTGRVEFYFIPEGTITHKLINESTVLQETCQLSSNGTTSVYFKPSSSGMVYAKYIDENDFYTAVTPTNPDGVSDKKNLVLSDIPINIEFTELPPYITDVHDEVKVKVHVTNAKDNTDVKYGTVTFMHYLVHDDLSETNKRVPDIVGNPVPVIDGYAEISYIPVQSDDYGYTNSNDDTEPEILNENGSARYVEYLRASFNYGGAYPNAEKGIAKWKYYGTASKWTGINVCARNSITINVSLPTEGNTGLYKCSDSDTVTLSAILKDKNDNPINFTNHSGTLTFHVKGVHPHPKATHIEGAVPSVYTNDYEQTTSEFEFIEYEKDIVANFSNNQFTAQLIKPLPGFYTITATTEIQTDEGAVLINYAETDNDVENDKKYAPVNESNIIYLSSNYSDIPNYNVTVQHDTGCSKTKVPLNNLIGIVDGLSNNQMSMLNNQRCYFYIPMLNKKYRGTLSYDASSQTLIGTPSEDITFPIQDNYEIYMYVSNGVYTSNMNVTTYHHDITSTSSDTITEFYIPFVLSAPLTMEVRDDIALELSANIINSDIPARVSYNIVGRDLFDEVTVQLIARLTTQSTEQVVGQATLFKLNPIDSGTIELNTPGEYEIYARGDDMISNKVHIVVNKPETTQTLPESSETVYASTDNTMGVYMSSPSDIRTADTNKIHAYIYDNNKSNKREVQILEVKLINNHTLYVVVKTDIYTEGIWYIQLTYEGDSNFAAYEGPLEQFSTELDTPTVTLTPANNNYNVQITSPHTNTQNSNYIIAEVIFANNNSKVGQGIFITDNHTSGSFNDIYDNHNTVPWWNNWNNVTFIFNSHNTQLISLLQNNNPPYNALKNKYGYVFDANRISDTSNLYWQLNDHNNQYIFDTYKSTQVRVTRPAQL